MPQHWELAEFDVRDRPALFREYVPVPPGSQTQHNIVITKRRSESKHPSPRAEIAISNFVTQPFASKRSDNPSFEIVERA